jgi:hypothetical protein
LLVMDAGYSANGGLRNRWRPTADLLAPRGG